MLEVMSAAFYIIMSQMNIDLSCSFEKIVPSTILSAEEKLSLFHHVESTAFLFHYKGRKKKEFSALI